jgi:tRNA A-37 threonylcarbamoyl transferase component Bud32
MPLPLPPPERDADAGEEAVSRVRMSGYLPDPHGRELPRLPNPWGPALDEDESGEVALAALRDDRAGGEPTATVVSPPAIDRGDLQETIGGPTTIDPRFAAGPPVAPRATLPGSRSKSGKISGGMGPLPPAIPPVPPRTPAPPPVPRLPGPGTQIAGRYQIVERIGQGGMGKVYKVIHAQLGKVFALKLIGEELAATPEARELFYREARLASSMSHPNIATVMDFGEDPQLGLFMVMELIEGEPLARLLHREKRLSVRQACEIIQQIAEALRYIHDNDVVHCDIKTENILITEMAGQKRRQLQAKLLDFGLARSLSTSRITSSLSGTPHYVAPERIRGEPPAPTSDIYGLGILFYELLTGKVPWDGHVAQILAGHLEQPPTPPSRLIEGGLDPAVENLILHALAKTPAERHKDMAAFVYELRTVMDMLGFGRRARRGGPRRVVIERTTNERDAMIRGVFEGCRLPLALVARSGLIVVANPAFARFVMGADVEVEGLTVQSTPLVGAWDAFEHDLARAIGGHGVRRILEVDLPSGAVRRLLLWLDPGAGDHAILGVQPLDV